MVGAVGMDIDKVAPELREATKKMPNLDLSKAWLRTLVRMGMRLMRVPGTDTVAVSAIKVAGLRLRIYRPQQHTGNGALLWIHGGGLLIGDARQDELLCAQTARELGIIVVSANYRLAPEHPYPAAHNDVYQAWQWMLANAGELGFDSTRVAIGGESAGAGLAASLVHRIHDEGGVQPVAQWLFAPMLDDRTAVDTSLDSTNHWVWNNHNNRIGWGAYLGSGLGSDDLSSYAAAARRVELNGLAPTYIAVGDIELFHAEDQDYARRLEQAGVQVVFDLVPGAPHGFESWARDTQPALELMLRARKWLQGTLVADGSLEE